MGRQYHLAALLLLICAWGCGSSEQEAEAGHSDQPALGQRRAQVMGYADSMGQALRGGNRAPEARFESRPQEGWAGLTTYTFDAAFSVDDRDLSGQLSKRFDFDGDGTWDIRATRRTRVYHTFKEPGTYRPRLIVQDTDGLRDSIIGEPIVVKKQCPPPDFALADINSNSPTFGETFRLAEQKGKRVLVWYATPSK